MMQYKEATHYEINKAVAKHLKVNTIAYDRTEIVLFDDMDATPFDPCNNPADAMPIIIENRIDLTHLVGGTVCAKHKEYWCIRKSPYRAGCEVYLLMKDAENEK